MVISKDKNFIFVHTPKTAGTCIERVISKYADFDKENSRHDKKHLYLYEIKKHLEDHDLSNFYNNAFKFIIVRDPWNMLVSKYNHIIRSKINPWSDIFKSLTIPEWIDFLYHGFFNYSKNLHNSQRISTYEHFSTVDGNNNIDYYIKFENLNNDFNKLCKKLKLNDDIHLTPIGKSYTTEVCYKHYYDSVSRDMVYEMFENDIKKHNYSF